MKRARSILVALCCVLIACQDDSGEPLGFGPLAAANGVGGDLALASGTLLFTDDCVLLVSNGFERLLVWPADRAQWNEAARTISYTSAEDGQVVELEDGDDVELVGGGSDVPEGDPASDEWVAMIDWVAEPDSVCLRNHRWGVGDVLSING